MVNHRIFSLLIATVVAFWECVAVAQQPLDQPPVDHEIAKPFDDLANVTVPTMEWSATTQREHQKWRAEFQAKLRELLGRMPERVPLEVKWTERREFDTFTRHKVYVQTEKSYWAPVYYFVPHDLKKPVPAIICLHGHSGIHPYIRADRSEEERKTTRNALTDYAVFFAEHGYVSAAIVVRGWNETAGYKDRGITHVTRSCHQVTMNAFLQGMTPQGLRSWDAMRVIDFLQDQENVDGQRIAVAGLSGGGTLATYLPVLDDRVKLAMIGGAFSSYRTSIYAMYHCICNCLPGIMQCGDMSDVVALHAPRPVLLINGIKDRIFPIAEARTGFTKLQRVYQLLGEPDRVDADFFDGSHSWSNNKTLSFLEKHFGRDKH